MRLTTGQLSGLHKEKIQHERAAGENGDDMKDPFPRARASMSQTPDFGMA